MLLEELLTATGPAIVRPGAQLYGPPENQTPPTEPLQPRVASPADRTNAPDVVLTVPELAAAQSMLATPAPVVLTSVPELTSSGAVPDPAPLVSRKSPS